MSDYGGLSDSMLALLVVGAWMFCSLIGALIAIAFLIAGFQFTAAAALISGMLIGIIAGRVLRRNAA